MNRIKIAVFVFSFFPYFLFAQDYLAFEEEKRIKFSDDYYWAESSDFSLEQATIQAMDYLVETIISDSVYQTFERNEVHEELERKVNKARIRQEGKFHIIVWIAKEMTQQKNNDNSGGNKNSDTDSAIEALKGCKDYKEVNLVTRQYGFLRCKINSSKGFDHPEHCIIAVFSADYTMVALLDKGESSRVDLLTGQVINNPETYYDKKKGYILWYFQQ